MTDNFLHLDEVQGAGGVSGPAGQQTHVIKKIVGVDEVGRGSLAGPLVVGAVALAAPIAGLQDSKLLAKQARENLDRIIRAEALGFGLGWISPGEIDRLGLTNAESLAIRRALDQIKIEFDEVIIDGNYDFLAAADNVRDRTLYTVSTVVKADVTIPAVSAASVIAKVARDRYMAEAASRYPGYGFEAHVGYGTRAHRLALQKLGPCELHRRSFAPVRRASEQLI